MTTPKNQISFHTSVKQTEERMVYASVKADILSQPLSMEV